MGVTLWCNPSAAFTYSIAKIGPHFTSLIQSTFTSKVALRTIVPCGSALYICQTLSQHPAKSNTKLSCQCISQYLVEHSVNKVADVAH